jgi:acetyltransferase-like isoleucine patch superfamily enzyme
MNSLTRLLIYSIRNSFEYLPRCILRFYKLAKLSYKIPSLRIDGPTEIIYDSISAISFGNDIYIGPFSEIIAIKKTPFSTVEGHLSIGDGVIIGKGANIRAAGGRIEIGEGALFAQNVSLIAANHSFNPTILYRDQVWDTNRVGVIINKNVFLGTGVIILPGVEVGENSVIAAGAVVTKCVPSNQVWAGVPARCIKTLV